MNLIPIYLVIVNASSNIHACEVFFDKDVAFSEAFHLGMKLPRYENFRKNPSKQTDEKGQVYWVALDTNTHTIVIMERFINQNDLNAFVGPQGSNLKDNHVFGATYTMVPFHGGTTGPTGQMVSATSLGSIGGSGYEVPKGIPNDLERSSTGYSGLDLRGVTGATSPFYVKPKGYVVMKCNNGIMEPVVVPYGSAAQKPDPKPVDDAFSMDLPAGWDFNNKPITIGQFLKDPQSYKDLADFSEDHLFALAIARLNKRPHYCGDGNLSKDEVISELKSKTPLGWEIRDQEILALENFINTEFNKAFP